MSTATAIAPPLGGEYLTVKQVTEALDLTSETVCKMIRAGELPAQRIGRKWHISRRALDARLAPAAEDETPAPTAGPVGGEDTWLAETLAKFTADDLRRAGEIFRAIADAAAPQAVSA
nr:helix-turn-helix domain-containing protein [Mycobacterium sp. UM_NZ2]